VTPPFTRPMGFVGEPPSQPLPPPAATAAMGIAASLNQQPQQQQQHHQQHPNGVAPVLVPTTSLDLLHSSPFRQPMYGSHYFGSSTAADPFSSSMGSGAGAGGDVAFSSSPGGGGSGMMMKLRMMNTNMLHPRLQEDPDDIMPFAVDDAMDEEPIGGAATHTTSGGLTASSSSTLILRDMIQPPKRLQLFESTSAASGVGGVATSTLASQSMAHGNSDFAGQLAEFKSFGASLLGASASQPGGGSGEVEAA
jgi:hypothetical protein